MAEAKADGDFTIKILAMEKVSKAAVALFRKEGYEVTEMDKLEPEDLKKEIATVHGICVRSKTKLTEEVLDAAEKLQCVGCFCIGTDQTKLSHAASKGIPVFNAPYANTRSVSELVIAEIIMLARQAGDRSKECHSGQWNKTSKNCFEVRGKTLGIIGYGHVGSQLSVLAESMGMKVMYYDIVPQLPLGNARSAGSMEELLAESDFISLHVPATAQTKGMVTKELIAKMKPQSYLINAARGNVVDVDAVAEALHSGHLRGAAFDVYPEEPLGNGAFSNPLIGCPNTILTPHIGGSTEEAQVNIGLEVAQKMIAFINKGTTTTAVNVPEVDIGQPLPSGQTRILNFHQNVPGVMREINNILAGANITMQHLKTDSGIGYLVVELEAEAGGDVKEQLKMLKHSINTRVLYHGPNYRGQRL